MSHQKDNVRSFTLICMFILFIQVKNSFTIPATLTTTNSNSNSNSNINSSNSNNSNNSSSSNNVSSNSSNDSSHNHANGDSSNVHEAVSSSSANSSLTTYEKCVGPGDPGPCKNYLYKYRFEATTNQCVTFIWGGCEGNSQNRFNTEAECLYQCIGAPCKYIFVPFMH